MIWFGCWQTVLKQKLRAALPKGKKALASLLPYLSFNFQRILFIVENGQSKRQKRFVVDFWQK